MEVTCWLVKLRASPQRGIAGGRAAVTRLSLRPGQPGTGSCLCPARNGVDVLKVSSGDWGVMFSHGTNYSSQMNRSGHGARLVKTSVPASTGRGLRWKQRLAFAFALQ